MVALGEVMPVEDAGMAWHRCKPLDVQYGKMAASIDR
jgi:hypothetical protein